MYIVSERPSACPVYLTLSAIAKNTVESQLEINWGPDCMSPPHWIGLYRSDPSLSDDKPVHYVQTGNESTGKVLTDIKLGHLHLPTGWNRHHHRDGDSGTADTTTTTILDSDEQPPLVKWDGSVCLPFYVAAYSVGNEISAMNCLKIQPQWMTKQPHLWDVPLRKIFIPGTHCAGCYANKSTGRSALLRKYGYTQNFDVWTQLVMGVRYLDISVG